jgi:hypothetical protein
MSVLSLLNKGDKDVVMETDGLDRIVDMIFDKLSLDETKRDKIINVLFCQSKYNSPLFVSHGMDHSLRVCKYGLELVGSSVFKKFLVEKYPDNYEETMLICLLLHDIGYIEYENSAEYNDDEDYYQCLCQFCEDCDKETVNTYGIEKTFFRKFKFLHAAMGEGWLKLNIEDTINIDDIKYAVLHHNSDSNKNTEYDPTIHGRTCSIKNKFARPYITCSIEESPLLAILRIADNLDLVRGRLSIEQLDKDFIMFQKNVSIDPKLLDDDVYKGKVSRKIIAIIRNTDQI